MLVNVEESSAFLLADEVLPYLGRIPTSLFGRPLAWLGTYGLQPVDPEVARYLKLDNQSAAVVSEVLEGSPAEARESRSETSSSP
jgi:serine protease Do